MELADRVKLRRHELDMSQDELARRMGYKSRSSINKIEMGRPVSQKIIVKLAESLNVTPAYLMGWEDDENDKKSQTVDDLAAGVPLALYDGADYNQVPEDIKQLAAAFTLAKKEQDYKNPAVKKIIEICNEHPDAVEDILLFAEALKRRSEKK